jgi:hypothetical protein
MIQEARELGFADVTFLQKLQESKNSVVFKVLVHGTTCVMKVVSASLLSLTPS